MHPADPMNTGDNNLVPVQFIQNRASRDTLFSPGVNIGRQKHLLGKAAIRCSFLTTPICAVEPIKQDGTEASSNPPGQAALGAEAVQGGRDFGAEFGKQAGVKAGPNIAGSYMGYAVKV